jgi:hypothetical protein
MIAGPGTLLVADTANISHLAGDKKSASAAPIGVGMLIVFVALGYFAFSKSL